jgi:hypothetical protein
MKQEISTSNGLAFTGKGNLTTTSPATAVGNIHSEFGGHATIRALFGLSRTHLHRLTTEGLIKSVCLRQHGKTRGRRLYVVASVRDYLLANIATGATIGGSK